MKTFGPSVPDGSSWQQGPGEAATVCVPSVPFAWLSLARVPGQRRILTQNPPLAAQVSKRQL